MVTDQVGDMLNRIKNAQAAGHPSVSIPASRNKARILEVIKAEGYIAHYEEVQDANNKPVLKVNLKYDSMGLPAIKSITRLSRPGRRHYMNNDDVQPTRCGLGLMIVSTSQGVMSDRDAKTAGVGGEAICSIF